jgi:hypothetical protein
MKTPDEVLARMGITPTDSGHPTYTYAELRDVVADVMDEEATYFRNLMRAVRHVPLQTPEPGTPPDG